MIDTDEIVASRVLTKVERAPLEVGYIGRLGYIARKHVHTIWYPKDERFRDLEIGVVSQPRGFRQRIDPKNSTYYMTDYAREDTTYALIDTALGRLVQMSTGNIESAQNIPTSEFIQPPVSIYDPEGIDVLNAMHAIITGNITDVSAPRRILGQLHTDRVFKMEIV